MRLHPCPSSSEPSSRRSTTRRSTPEGEHRPQPEAVACNHDLSRSLPLLQDAPKRHYDSLGRTARHRTFLCTSSSHNTIRSVATLEPEVAVIHGEKNPLRPNRTPPPEPPSTTKSGDNTRI